MIKYSAITLSRGPNRPPLRVCNVPVDGSMDPARLAAIAATVPDAVVELRLAALLAYEARVDGRRGQYLAGAVVDLPQAPRGPAVDWIAC